MSSAQFIDDTGIVVIGRNEGERLRRCLASLPEDVVTVYVDSGSWDDSVTIASDCGAHVVELDESQPYTAARSRNAGVKRLREILPGVCFVQLVDGDCELRDGWLRAGHAFLKSRPEAAAIMGHLRERRPADSIYNLLCDMEWEGPVGEVPACGGIVMLRLAAFDAAGGFREDLIAGEEPELCVRMRAAGWVIHRLDREMASHDAAMTRFTQWWRRSIRGGHAASEGAFLHGAPPECHGVRQVRSALCWGLALPVIIGAALVLIGPLGLLFLLLYPVQVVRIALRGKRSPRENLYRAFFLVLGKFPEALGVITFQWRRWVGSTPRTIEYK